MCPRTLETKAGIPRNRFGGHFLQAAKMSTGNLGMPGENPSSCYMLQLSCTRTRITYQMAFRLRCHHLQCFDSDEHSHGSRFWSWAWLRDMCPAHICVQHGCTPARPCTSLISGGLHFHNCCSHHSIRRASSGPSVPGSPPDANVWYARSTLGTRMQWLTLPGR